MSPLLTDGELAKMEQTLAQFHRASGLLYVHPPHDLSIGEQDSLLADARWHRKALAEARAENARLREAVLFYADPATWWATIIVSDPPCGDIVNDIGSTQGWEDIAHERPGAKARAALAPKEPK